MSARTVADVEADIAAVKKTNLNWLADAGDKALITAYINEKNALLTLSSGDFSSLKLLFFVGVITHQFEFHGIIHIPHIFPYLYFLTFDIYDNFLLKKAP